MNRFNIIIGDWSDDGHGKTYQYTIETECTKKEISTAYERGVKEIGFDLVNDVAREYEDSTISFEQEAMLKKVGIALEEYFDKYELKHRKDSYDPLSIWYDNYFYLWMKFVEVGKPPHLIKEVKYEDIKIGGYGLFY